MTPVLLLVGILRPCAPIGWAAIPLCSDWFGLVLSKGCSARLLKQTRAREGFREVGPFKPKLILR